MSSLSSIVSVSDARLAARRMLPRTVFDYIEGGAEDELTMAENEQAFRDIALRPRMGVRVEAPVLATTVVGTQVSMPVLLAPCGLLRLMHPHGAAGAIRAANGAGTIAVLSSSAGTPPEGCASEPGPKWFQLYAPDRTGAEALMQRAADAGFEALVVTMDTPTLGKRERDSRNGWAGTLRVDLRTARNFGPQLAMRPIWLGRMLGDTIGTLRNPPLPGASAGGGSGTNRRTSGRTTTRSRSGQSQDSRARALGPVPTLASPFTWEDVAWIRRQWSAPLLVKGVLSAPDAVAAAEAGADGLIVSNHGGRQLDGSPATLRVLPEVVDAVGERIEVLVDGGVRRSGDVVKALAIGARAVLIGRPYLYALAAAGEAGVSHLLEMFRLDIIRTMMLLGCPSVADLDRSWIQSMRTPIVPAP